MKNIGQHVAEQVDELIKTGKAIVFGSDIPDKEYSEIRWSQYGLIDTNEIAVVVKCGSNAFGTRDQSRLVMPTMAERIYGMDAADESLAVELCEKLWNMFSDELIKEVHRIRKSG